jgi:hypothetical protein
VNILHQKSEKNILQVKDQKYFSNSERLLSNHCLTPSKQFSAILVLERFLNIRLVVLY